MPLFKALTASLQHKISKIPLNPVLKALKTELGEATDTLGRCLPAASAMSAHATALWQRAPHQQVFPLSSLYLCAQFARGGAAVASVVVRSCGCNYHLVVVERSAFLSTVSSTVGSDRWACRHTLVISPPSHARRTLVFPNYNWT